MQRGGRRLSAGRTDASGEKMRRWPRTGDIEIRRWKREQTRFIPTEPKEQERAVPTKPPQRKQQYVAHPDLYLPEALRGRPSPRKVVLTFLLPHLVFGVMLLATLLPPLATSMQILWLRLAVVALAVLAAALGYLSLKRTRKPTLLDRLGTHGAMNAACLALAGTVALLVWGLHPRAVPNLVALLALRALPHRSRLPLSWVLSLAAVGVAIAGALVTEACGDTLITTRQAQGRP
mgnify:CR=1 FL=1